jgi:predicted nucleic acid-binding protein
MIGADTGFFFALREGDPIAVGLFEREEIAVSVLTRFELKRLAHRKGIPWPDIGVLLARSTTAIDLTGDAAEEAASISHGTGMPALDALILSSLLAAGCRTIYTRDEHLLRFSRKDVEIIRL